MVRQPAQIGRLSGFISGAALLIAASLQAVASTGINPECPSLRTSPTSEDFAPPSLRFERTELGNSAPPITAPEAPGDDSSPTLASSEVIDELLGNDETGKDEAGKVQEPPPSRAELPPTATRLPGVDDEDLPRFRRQMFRTDI